MKSTFGTLVSLFLALLIAMLAAPSQSLATQPDPVDVFDIYAGVAQEPDMMKCCGCHTQQCYGTNASATWTPVPTPAPEPKPVTGTFTQPSSW